jgi:hypothetical protein
MATSRLLYPTKQEADMDANQRSESNNQTNNGANEKWTPGAKGTTTSGPMDHTYPNGASEGGAQSGTGMAHAGGHDQGGLGGSPDGSGQGGDLPGGSMQHQQTGGSGPQQGITDSHQRQMEMRSGAWGELEQPVGNRPADSGTSLRQHPANQQGNTQATAAMNPQNPAQPELQGGVSGNRQSAQAQNSGTGSGTGSGTSTSNTAGQSADSTDRSGSQTAAGARDAGSHDVHQSNDVAGGLPRSPGGTGPRTEDQGYKPGGSMQAEPNPVHESNDAAGGYPRSPGGANKLAGDRKMDDDTGFSR